MKIAPANPICHNRKNWFVIALNRNYGDGEGTGH